MLSASKILIKRSSTPGSVPSTNQLESGELALNLADKKIFFKNNQNDISFIDISPYTLLENLSSVVFKIANNEVTGPYSGILGGYFNDVSGGGSTTINGENNDIAGDFALIGNGLNNTIGINGDYSVILGGKNNTLNHQESFIIGSNITSHLSGFTYVNNLSSLGKIYGDGSGLTGITAETGSQTLSFNEGTKDLSISNGNTVSLSALVDTGGSGIDAGVRALTGNWETAYAYVSANSVNLTAANINVTNNLTVTNTISAKYYQGTLLDWMTLVRGYKTTPTLLATIGTGDVYTYVYATTGTDKTYYRYIATDGSEDSFYGNFSNPTLSNLITTKKIIL